MAFKLLLIVPATLIALLGGGIYFSQQDITLGAAPVFTVPQGGTGWGNVQSGTYLTGNGTGRLSTSTCAQITGSADLCDGSDATGAGGSYPFIPTAHYGTTTQATSSAPWFRVGLFASSTSHFVNASTTLLSATTLYGALVGNADTATALAANGANCAAGNYPLGVDASGAVEDCTADANTTYTAGDHLTLTGTDFDVDDDFLLNTGDTGTGHYILDSLFATNASSTNATTSSLYITNSGGLFIDDRADNFYLNVHAWDNGNTQDRDLKILVNDGDRFLNLGGDFTLSGGSISLTGPASVTLPSSGTLAALGGTNTWSALNTFSTGVIAASSSISNLTAINGTTTNATSTNLNVSGQVDFDGLTSALVLTGSTGILAEYSGIDCTNQFVRDVSAAGAGTCATVGAADVSLANLTATNGTLTFSGTYNGSTARSIGLNLANANTWTAHQIFSSLFATNASSTNATTTSLYIGSHQEKSFNELSWSYGSTTQGLGTTTRPIVKVVGGAGTMLSASCHFNQHMRVLAQDEAGNRMNDFVASSTEGTVSLSTNNTFSDNEVLLFYVGTTTASLGNVYGGCTFKYVYN